VLLGAAQLALAIRFAMNRDDSSARPLLRASLLYLPAWLTMLLVVTI
jgi:heme O synthase-like polyprenyltransferase